MSLRPSIQRENTRSRQVEEDVYNGVREIPRMMMVLVNGERCVPDYAWLMEEGRAVPYNARVISLSGNGQSVILFEEGGEIPIIVPSAPNLAPLTPDNQPNETLLAQVNQPYPQMQPPITQVNQPSPHMQPPIITRVNEPLLAQVNQPSPQMQPPIITRVNQRFLAVQRSVFSQVNLPPQVQALLKSQIYQRSPLVQHPNINQFHLASSQMRPPGPVGQRNEQLLLLQHPNTSQVNQPSPQMQPPIITRVDQRFLAVQRSVFSQVNLPPQVQALLKSQIYQRSPLVQHPNITQLHLASSQMWPPGPVGQRNEQLLLLQHPNTSQVNPPSPQIRPPVPVGQCSEQLPLVHHPNTSQVNPPSPQIRPPGPDGQCNEQLPLVHCPNTYQVNPPSLQIRPPRPVGECSEQLPQVHRPNTSQVNPPSPQIRPPGPVGQCNEQLPLVHCPNTYQVNLLSPPRPPGPVDQRNDQLQPLGISELNQPDPPLQGPDFIEGTFPYFQQAFLSLVMYLILGVGLYFLMMHGEHIYGCRKTSSIDPFYFLMVIMSTTGYGDQYPTSAFAKLSTCLLILCGCGFVAGRFSALFECLSSGFGNILFGYMAQRSGHPISERSRDKVKFWSAILVVIVCIVVGLVGGRLEGMGWIDSLYFSIVSVTSVGFGDHKFKSDGGRVFAIFWLPVSTSIVGLIWISCSMWISKVNVNLYSLSVDTNAYCEFLID